MTRSLRLDRRAFLKGIGGISLALPVLDAMGAEVTDQIPRRFCAIYTANGMSLPKEEHALPEWSWFPPAGPDGDFAFGKSTEPLEPFREKVSFLGNLYHPNGPKADPHTCSDMWLTGAPLQNPEAGHLQHRRNRSGDRAAHQAVLPPAFAGALDRRRNRIPVAHGHHFLQPRRAPDPGREQSAAHFRPPVPRGSLVAQG